MRVERVGITHTSCAAASHPRITTVSPTATSGETATMTTLASTCTGERTREGRVVTVTSRCTHCNVALH